MPRNCVDEATKSYQQAGVRIQNKEDHEMDESMSGKGKTRTVSGIYH
jgi:hypothetical protein